MPLSVLSVGLVGLNGNFSLLKPKFALMFLEQHRGIFYGMELINCCKMKIERIYKVETDYEFHSNFKTFSEYALQAIFFSCYL
jgi:hypothetical protein